MSYKVKVQLVGITPLGFGKAFVSEKEQGESAADFDKRCWRERIMTNGDGEAVINPMSLKYCLIDSAKYKGDKIQGKGNKTWTQKFKCGLAIDMPLKLGVKAVDIPCEIVFVPSDGIHGSGSRVNKHFPKLENWKTEAIITVIDGEITPEKLEEVLRDAGDFIGLGTFRPSSSSAGYWGKFRVESIEVIG